MSAYMVVALFCDHAGCAECFEWHGGMRKTGTPRKWEARRAARQDGWRSGVRKRPDSGPAPTVDFCPQHAGDIDNFSEVIP